MRDLLASAIEKHQRGNSPGCGAVQKVLDGDPDNANALHLLGVLQHQWAEHARAV